MKLIYFSRWIYVQQVCFLLLTLVLKVIKKPPVGKIGIFVYFCSFLLERTSQKKGCLVVNKQIVVGPTFFTTAEMLIFYAVNRLGQNGDALQDLQVGCCWCLNHLFWVVLKKKTEIMGKIRIPSFCDLEFVMWTDLIRSPTNHNKPNAFYKVGSKISYKLFFLMTPISRRQPQLHMYKAICRGL